MKLEDQDIVVQDIDYLGIIAGIIDKMHLVELIDTLIQPHQLEIVTTGMAVKAMILNCMGFLTSPLYLFSKFFEDKPVEHLLSENIQSKHLNDSRLGRALDEVYQYGVTKLFLKIALQIVSIFNIDTSYLHADTTSLSVHGKYENKKSSKDGVNVSETVEELQEEKDNEEPYPIEITYGYSRDHRPDLKQFTMGLITNGGQGIPVMMTIKDGNESDKQHFQKIMKDFVDQWDGSKMNFFVMDSGAYSAENIREWQCTKWIIRAPRSIRLVADLIESTKEDDLKTIDKDPRYKILEVDGEYAGINQRWFLVQSEPRRQSDIEDLDKTIAKENKQKNKDLEKLNAKGFACEADAFPALDKFNKELKYHTVKDNEIISKPQYSSPGRPVKGQEPSHYRYYIEGGIIANEDVISIHKNKAGRFVLASNCLDKQSLSGEDALFRYKDQQGTERGFRFIKDPLFFASSVFLKNTSRIMALTMIMALALMVYALGEKELRDSLEKAEDTVPNQKGKPTSRPTLRWTFQCFQSVHLIIVNGVKSFVDIKKMQKTFLKFLPPECQRYYFLTGMDPGHPSDEYNNLGLTGIATG